MKPLLYKIKKLLKSLRRKIYAIRLLVPGLREQHKLEISVGPVGYWKKLRAYQLNALQLNGLKPEHKLLDFGCGPLQGGIAFIKYLNKNCYYGVDIRKQQIDNAHKQITKFKLESKKPTMILSDNFGENELKDIKFDYVWASQLLYYFDNKNFMDLLTFISDHLNQEGKFIFDILGPENRDNNYAKENRMIYHNIDKLESMAASANLQKKTLGRILDFGYPKRLTLRTNSLLEINHRQVFTQTHTEIGCK
jgi:SAM-dependent methyltransferase